MGTVLVVIAAALVLTMVAGIGRALIGPSRSDRILAVQLLGTAGAATLLVLAEAGAASALRDVALVLVLLAAMATVVWMRRTGAGGG